MLRFLAAIAQPRAATPLAAYGFTQEDLDEGWKRLHAAAGDKLMVAPSGKPDPTKLALLDDWENLWFPITLATLRHNYPEVSEKVFLNLSQQSGLDVLISVKTLVERVEALANGSAEEQAARAHLAHRGLTDARLGEAKALLAGVATIEVPDPIVPDPEAAAAAKKAMWSWYLEWSAIARSVIKDRRVLRSLGFLRKTGSSSNDADDAEDVEDESNDPAPDEA